MRRSVPAGRNSIRRALVHRGVILLSLAWLAACQPERPKTVVFLTLDTLKTNHLDAYNVGLGLTPELQQLADTGTVFDHAYTQVPLTLPAHTSLFTGTSPVDNGVMANGDRVPLGLETAAEVLKSAGFATGAFPSLGVLQADFGLDRGFDTYDTWNDDTYQRAFRRAPDVIDSAIEWLRGLGDAERAAFMWVHLSDPHEPYHPIESETDFDVVRDDVVLLEGDLATRKVFQLEIEIAPGSSTLTLRPQRRIRRDEFPTTRLILNRLATRGSTAAVQLKAPDLPYVFGSPLDLELMNSSSAPIRVVLEVAGGLGMPPKSQVRKNYAAEVALLDSEVGRLKRELADQGRLEETLWVVVTDHGEGLFKHGVLGHSDAVWEDQLHLGWFLSGHGVPSQRIAAPVLNTDVAPTLLEIAGLPALAIQNYGSDATGRSQARCVRERSCEGRSSWTAYGLEHQADRVRAAALYRWPLKAVWHEGRRERAYNLLEDPRETRRLSEDASGDLTRAIPKLRELLQHRLEERRSTTTAPATRRMLEDLGYL